MNSYTHALTKEQAAKLRVLLEELGFEFSPKEWTIFFAQKNKLSVAVYEKGPKVLVQGRGVEEFVQFELEPKILGEAKVGYEEVHGREMFEQQSAVDARVINASLLKHGRKIAIEQRPRAESDIAVAAASIVAREAFINWLERKSKELDMRLQRGVSPSVKEAAKKLVEMNGPDALREVAKVHFRTAHEIAPNDYPAPPPRENWQSRN